MPDECQVRPALPADIPAIARLHVAAWRAAYRGIVPDAALASLDEGRRAGQWREWSEPAAHVILVAVRERAVIGVSFLMPSRDPDATPATAEIAALYIAPDHWRTGAGAALFNTSLQRARQRGDQALTLWVFEENMRARHFYERQGLTPDGARKSFDKMGARLTEVRYRRDLSDD